METRKGAGNTEFKNERKRGGKEEGLKSKRPFLLS